MQSLNLCKFLDLWKNVIFLNWVNLDNKKMGKIQMDPGIFAIETFYHY